MVGASGGPPSGVDLFNGRITPARFHRARDPASHRRLPGRADRGDLGSRVDFEPFFDLQHIVVERELLRV